MFKIPFLVPSLILSLGIASAGLFARTGILEAKRFGQVVSVRGLAERVVESDEASWNLSFTLTDPDLSRLNVRMRNSQQIVEAFLQESGFEPKEIQKTAIQITDRMAEGYADSTKRDRYVARGGFLVLSKKVKALASASVRTEELVKKGVVPASTSLTYYFTNLNGIKPQMLKEATANARDAARSFAQHSQASVGAIRNATQGMFSIGSPYSDYDSGGSFLKKVRVVTHVEFFLR